MESLITILKEQEKAWNDRSELNIKALKAFLNQWGLETYKGGAITSLGIVDIAVQNEVISDQTLSKIKEHRAFVGITSGQLGVEFRFDLEAL